MDFNSTIFKTRKAEKSGISYPFFLGNQVGNRPSLFVYMQSGFAEINPLSNRFSAYKVLLLLSFLSLASCNSVQNKLDSIATEIEYAENNLAEMSEEDWAKLELSMAELEQNLELNRDDYSAEQIKEAGKIQGTYAALVMKKGLNDLQESIKDFGNQMEGFIEGIESDTTNN